MSRLLGSCAWDTFVHNYWQKQWLHVQRQQRDFFSSLVTMADVDELIATHGGGSDFPISVIGSHVGHQVAKELRSSDHAHWTPDRVYERLLTGATIRLGNMAHYLPAIRRLAAAFETALNTDVNINLYLTPRNARAFNRHFDNHDVFVAQVAGSKQWTIFSPPQDLPIEVVHKGRLSWQRRQLPVEGSTRPARPATTFSQDLVLQAGDLLYVPRGYVHQVCTTIDEASLHLTVATPVVTWYEVVVHALIDASAKSRALREALPVGFATDPTSLGAARTRVEEIVDAARTSLSSHAVAESLDELALRFIHSRDGHLPGHAEALEHVGTLSVNDVVRIRPNLAYTTRRGDTHILLMFAGRAVRVPLRCESMLTYLLAHGQCRIGDLPTHLSDQSRLTLVRTLVVRGLLET